MQAQMLAPAAALVAWSMIMLLWMAATRLPAIAKMGGLGKVKPGGRGQDLEGVLPDKTQWKSHNFTHLMEQPTIYYAAVVIIAMIGPAALDITIAWVYLIARVLHSLWQSLVNTVPVRFSLFMVCNLAMLYLAYRAVMLTVFADPGTL